MKAQEVFSVVIYSMPPYIPAFFFLSGDASEVYCLNLKLNISKSIGGKFLGMFLVIPFLVLVDLGAFYVLVLGVATLAHILPEQEDIDRKEQISLNLL